MAPTKRATAAHEHGHEPRFTALAPSRPSVSNLTWAALSASFVMLCTALFLWTTSQQLNIHQFRDEFSVKERASSSSQIVITSPSPHQTTHGTHTDVILASPAPQLTARISHDDVALQSPRPQQISPQLTAHISQDDFALPSPRPQQISPGRQTAAPQLPPPQQPKIDVVRAGSSAVTPRNISFFCPEDDEIFHAALREAEAGYAAHIRRREPFMLSFMKPPYTLQKDLIIALLLIPTYPCLFKERLGAWGPGGKWLCLGVCPRRTKAGKARTAAAPIVVSLGGKGPHSFETEAATLLSAQAHIFDPLADGEVKAKLAANPGVTLHSRFGVVGSKSVQHHQEVKPYNVKEWVAFQDALGDLCARSSIDVLVLDCYGCEIEVIHDIQSSASSKGTAKGTKLPRFGQILVSPRHLDRIPWMLAALEERGYRLFAVEEKDKAAGAYELAFIHETLVRPQGRKLKSPTFPALGSASLCSGGGGFQQALAMAEAGYARGIARRRVAMGPLLKPPYDVTKNQLMSEVLLPAYSCTREERLGQWGEGGKWVCLGHCFRNLSRPLVAVSIGSRGESSFESEVFQVLRSSRIDTLDPSLSPGEEQRMATLLYMKFHSLGLSGEGHLAEARAAHADWTFVSVRGMLKAVRTPYVDVFKIDCEGCEFGVVEEMVRVYRRDTPPPFGQIQMELHNMVNRLSNTTSLVLSLESLGYRLFHAEPNAWCRVCYEVAFVHETVVAPWGAKARRVGG